MQALNDIFFREKCAFRGKTSENGIEGAISGEICVVSMTDYSTGKYRFFCPTSQAVRELITCYRFDADNADNADSKN